MLSLSHISLAARTSALALAAATLVGCASTATTPATPPEQAVSERAQQRWDRLVAKDFDKAYTYLTPSYRGLKTPAQYANTFSNGASWQSAKVDKVTCESAERCTAAVKIEVVVLARGFTKPLESTLYETWLLDEGQWWFYQKD